jgi:hypothetical protein
MCMGLDRRLQVLLEERQHALLAREARRRGTSVGALSRDAIDRVYAGTAGDRERAAAELLAAEPMPVEDWRTMKARMLDELAGGHG